MRRIGMMLLAGSVVAGAAFVAGCQSTEIAEHKQLEHKQVVYQSYEYFPNSEIYFSPESKTYFWKTSGGWVQGTDLPAKYNLDREGSISLQLSTDKPYERHPEIHTIYPAHQPVVVDER